ncbi:MAG: TetR/AcrR family transcriptional regulator [Actinomycetes bacterium]
MVKPGVHPTKQSLIDAVDHILNTKSPFGLTTDEILSAAMISKGSLYHHFADLPELIETALIFRFSRYVNETIESLARILESSASREEALAKFVEAANKRVMEDSRAIRIERVHSLSMAFNDERFYKSLAIEQDRLTDEWETLYLRAKELGWAKPDLDSRSLGVFMQAHVIGQIVNDMSAKPMNQQEWTKLITYLFSVTFFGAEN